MKWLSMLALVVLAVGCNPAARCRATSECGQGVCTGGFCADLSGIARSDSGEVEDRDSSDAGQAVDAGGVDYDAGSNGRP